MTKNPQYRVGINIDATGVCTSVVFSGAHPSDSMTIQVSQAISYARMVHASRDDIEITNVFRKDHEDGSWYPVTSAFRAVPGTEIQVTGRIFHGGLQRTENHYYEGSEWVRVVRWEGAGDGTAWLIGPHGHRTGPYPKDFVFRTR